MDFSSLPRRLRGPLMYGELTADGDEISPMEVYRLDLADWVKWGDGDPVTAAAALHHAREAEAAANLPLDGTRGTERKKTEKFPHESSVSAPGGDGPVEGLEAAGEVIGRSGRTVGRMIRSLPPPFMRGRLPVWPSRGAVIAWAQAARLAQASPAPAPPTRPGGRGPRPPRPQRPKGEEGVPKLGLLARARSRG